MTGKKEAYRIIIIHSAGNSTHHKYGVYILWAKQVSDIGLMPLLLENSHAAALLNRVVNLVKEAMEHLNPD